MTRIGPITVGDDGRAGDDAWPVLETVQSTLLAVAVVALGVAPRAAPLVICALAVVTVIEAVLNGGGVPWRALAGSAGIAAAPLVAGLAFVSWAALSASWASEPAFALKSVLQIGLIVLAVGILAVLLPAQIAGLPQPRRRRFIRAVPMGFAAGLGFVGIEYLSGHAISLQMIRRFPGLMGDNAKEFVRDGDRILVLPFYLDRNVAALTLVLPGVAMALWGWLPPRVRKVGVGGVMALALVVIGASHSEAAKLAAVGGAVGAIALWRWPETGLKILRWAVVAGVLLALPIAHLPAVLGLDKAGWLPASARERIIIWNRTATVVRAAPLRGIGAQSTRFQEEQRVRVEGLPGERRELGWHAHNFVLQAWLELGVAGAGLLLWVLLALWGALRRQTPVGLPASGALFIMTLAIAVTGWGLWQPWLAASMGTAAVALVVGVASAGRVGPREGTAVGVG